MICCCAINPSSVLLLLKNTRTDFYSNRFQSSTQHFTKSNNCLNFSKIGRFNRSPVTLASTLVSDTESEYEEEDYSSSSNYAEDEQGHVPRTIGDGPPPPVRRRLRRYRKEYPGEKKGVTEEMRFVAMKLRNNRKSKSKVNGAEMEDDGKTGDNFIDEGRDGDTWQPSVDGFLKYLVDSRLVFSTVERIVDESADVSYVYFRKTGLERSDYLSRDLDWFREQGNVIPEPSNPGIEYARYLEELAETSPPLFLSHLYNIYFSHIAGGQVIAKQVSEKLLEGKELELHRWDDGDAEELLKAVREKLNALGVHWSRDEKTRCLRETTKAFRSLGQIIRLIIL